ncbi:MAG TPA: helicase-related protein [Trebonia sp.]|jgi:SNF2 family DNA or RNA helicase|nr:helicase-related protein [Trebonia sp.]
MRLEDVTPGAQLTGVMGAAPVTVVQATWIGGNALRLTYRTDTGKLDERLLYRDHEPRIDVVKQAAYDLSADGAEFKLAAEALRIRMAGRFDPMLAVHTSDLEPLPHQIQAVYGELLGRTPLRFLLADDPGAGKTIMAGLYIKELMLRGDLERCLIVAPGGLVEQWQDELRDKFGLNFELLTRQLADAEPPTAERTVFTRHKLLIARMDQLSRADDLRDQLDRSDWDLVVVDEAHRMSAHYFGSELKKTKRYQLGELLGRHTRHLLLMTATPHSGRDEDFQLFLALLDTDRFEGRYRDAVHTVNTDGLMRRMVKEDLKTFDGRPLFPERRAYTVAYQLSDAEQDLYEAVTQYVREEMTNADKLKEAGDLRRGATVGFALTVLQRRLASSPEAILKSLERRHKRLEKRSNELRYGDFSGEDKNLAARLRDLLGKDPTESDLNDFGSDGDDLPGGEAEDAEAEIADAATAARTIAELDKELAILADLTEIARRVRRLGTDKKWTELRGILTETMLAPPTGSAPDPAADRAFPDPEGVLPGLGDYLPGKGAVPGQHALPAVHSSTAREQAPASQAVSKIIIFTEHRDTLEYLSERIRDLLGRSDAVVTIHGGVRREERRRVTELFTQDKDVWVLVATDAAGEGLNLQRAHLMVNYDLPWNPNRIEQRFGRIHRIGQTEVCHLWNLVADGTREGMVFLQLLTKIEEQRKAYHGKVFDVLGEAFEGQPLKDLLVEAIRYGNRPEVRARLHEVIDKTVGAGLDKLIAERAAYSDIFAIADLEKWRARMDEANRRRLQPHYISAFFREAFKQLGGRLAERESGRYEIRHVPADIRDRDRQAGTAPAPVLPKYERVTFDKSLVHPEGKPKADLLAPGHPLLDAVTDLIIERYGTLLKQGTMLADRHDPGTEPRLLLAVTHEITDGHDLARTITKKFGFVEVDAQGPLGVRSAGEARYLDYEPMSDPERMVVTPLRDAPWLAAGVETIALDWAVTEGMPEELARTRDLVATRVAQVRRLVKQRLIGEINYWDMRHAALLDDQAAGRSLKTKPETAYARARDLERRLEKRLADLDRDEELIARPPAISAAALVVPQGLLAKLLGDSGRALFPRGDTTATERRAVDAVLAVERRLGRIPREMAHNNPGYDIESRCTDGHLIFIEVKGRVEGAEEFWVTRTEALHGKNSAARSRLAMVSVHPAGPESDAVRYIVDPFRDVDFGDFAATGMIGNWLKEWERGVDPV